MDAPVDDAADAAALARYAAELADAVAAALPGWVERVVGDVLVAQGRARDERAVEARAAGEAAAAEVVPSLRSLLATDIDEQRGNPLALLRRAVAFPTAVLREAGVEPAPRDEFAERSFPEDLYDLSPASFADVDPSLHEPGLRWGAAKAHIHLRRRRAEGQR